MRMNRRHLLAGLAKTALLAGAPAVLGASRRAFATPPTASRVIFFYFPDGVVAESQDGQPSLFHPTGGEHQFSLPDQLVSLEPLREQCLFFTGLSMGPTDSGSHPGGAKKLLTAVDGGGGWSIDHYLAQTAGADRAFRHLHLGVMANQNGASGDKHITYVAPGQTVSPEDNPADAFARLFGGTLPPPASGNPGQSVDQNRRARIEQSVLDGMKSELTAFRTRMGGADTAKLEFHLDSLRELENRLQILQNEGEESADPASACTSPLLDLPAQNSGMLYDPANFPQLLRAQIDVMVNAMACGLTRVGTLQCSHHTSELIMSRFSGTAMHTPNFDMRSHQASHYGASHDWNKAEFSHFVWQRQWWVSQFAYLLEQLQARPEGEGSMLDQSIVVLCSEVCDGNTHRHDNMPFVIAGGAGGAFSTGRLLHLGERRHGDLFVSIARAMGQNISSYGDGSTGPITEMFA